jgi:2'-5' RNA ligase
MADKTLRLFFALWPDESTRSALSAFAQEITVETGGRSVSPQNLHLTLAFLGEQSARLVNAIDPRAAAAVPRFQLALDALGCWAKNGIAWLGASTMAAELVKLEQGIVLALAAMGLEGDERPFAAHVTLARRIVRPLRPRRVDPLAWNVDSFALVSSVTAGSGRDYRVVRKWPLAH